MSDKDLEQIKKKLNELDARLTSLSKYQFSKHMFLIK